jgi:hypothetical protein
MIARPEVSPAATQLTCYTSRRILCWRTNTTPTLDGRIAMRMTFAYNSPQFAGSTIHITQAGVTNYTDCRALAYRSLMKLSQR